ncbi:MAG: imidazole glycerol phosphate synthase cyclase subunit, partial [Pseudomonadota bacterium]
IVASLYNRNNLSDIVRRAAENIFIPITVGGGIRSVEDAQRLLHSGADKIALNTAAIGTPDLINDLSSRFGSQCVVLSVEAKQIGDNKWECYTDNGREKTGRDVFDWIREAIERGAGELLITAVDREGTRKGFDTMLFAGIADFATIPVIASGGMGSSAHLEDVVKHGRVDAVAMADVLHYDRMSIEDIREHALMSEIGVRQI